MSDFRTSFSTATSSRTVSCMGCVAEGAAEAVGVMFIERHHVKAAVQHSALRSMYSLSPSLTLCCCSL
jgi:hypothetical protein